MEVLFDAAEKKLTINNCPYSNVEIEKDGVILNDIRLSNGSGFWINQGDIVLNDSFKLYPYDTVEVKQLQPMQDYEI